MNVVPDRITAPEISSVLTPMEVFSVLRLSVHVYGMLLTLKPLQCKS